MKGFITSHLFDFVHRPDSHLIKYKYENKNSLKGKYFKNIILRLTGEMYLFNDNISHSPK